MMFQLNFAPVPSCRYGELPPYWFPALIFSPHVYINITHSTSLIFILTFLNGAWLFKPSAKLHRVDPISPPSCPLFFPFLFLLFVPVIILRFSHQRSSSGFSFSTLYLSGLLCNCFFFLFVFLNPLYIYYSLKVMGDWINNIHWW
jgi:hypothetical protein